LAPAYLLRGYHRSTKTFEVWDDDTACLCKVTKATSARKKRGRPKKVLFAAFDSSLYNLSILFFFSVNQFKAIMVLEAPTKEANLDLSPSLSGKRKQMSIQ
jgi:hypothetical protein